MSDNITSPKHYTYGQTEVIDAIEGWGLGYHLGNVIKYVVRAGHKDPDKTIEDLQKAVWCLNRHIKNIYEERKNNANNT